MYIVHDFWVLLLIATHSFYYIFALHTVLQIFIRHASPSQPQLVYTFLYAIMYTCQYDYCIDSDEYL